MNKRGKQKISPEVKSVTDSIMKGRKQLKIKRKEAISKGDWEDIIPLLTDEDNPDVEFYRVQLERAGISLEGLKEIGRHSMAKIRKLNGSETIEIFIRKKDKSVFYMISNDGRVTTRTVDYYDPDLLS